MSKAVNLGTLADDISVSNGKANLSGVSLTPGSAPSSPVQGDIYLDSSDNNLKIWTGNFWKNIVNAGPSFSVDYLVVAGGGSGNDGFINANFVLGGGGGAGGLLNGYAELITNNSYFVEIGPGGQYIDQEATAPNGYDSQFSTFALAYGGGGGGTQSRLGGDGGSGGGGGSNSIAGGKGVYPGSSYIDEPRQGYDGATTINTDGGGGGGAGGAGGIPTAGIGKTFNITGSDVLYATGGAGGTSSTGNGANGSNNTGNGGGGSGPWSTGNKIGGNGGSGIVIISYSNIYPDLQTIHSSHVCNGQSSGTTSAPTPLTARSGYKTYTFTAGSGNISW